MRTLYQLNGKDKAYSYGRSRGISVRSGLLFGHIVCFLIKTAANSRILKQD
ncbi:hypothetical protein J21TS7_13600 [Paenibacillus cineris]|uniref:Uncharacterized protein n=1 Tax=Paenibacillus cineris TaxID=237530 RepID=A0ABQ4L9V6_9BACL|nr:hypothetical protein J21TS7_13600 [Paenibacillus cineris]